MKGLCYEKKIDLTLYRQMVDLVYRLSARADKAKTLYRIEKNSLFWEKPEQGLEESYGLHYPGEVLERLEEKTELTKPKIRALCLALGDTKEIHEAGMFVGSQFRAFLQRAFQESLQGDCYLLAADYLLADKGGKEAYGRLLDYPFSACEELLFALSVLPEDELLWEKAKEPLNQCFGTGHSLDVYEDAELYAWISLHLAERMKGYRKKDLENLKYFARLSKEPAREGSTVRRKLLEAGYSLAEILFLNAFFLKAGTFEILKDSIPAERLAIEFCKFVLNAEEVYPERMYALCDELLSSYREFSVKLGGANGILQYLEEDIQLKNCRSYQCLYPHKEESYRYQSKESLFYIDLTDGRWEPLYAWMGKVEFDRWTAKTILGKPYTDEALNSYLRRYEELTGRPYVSAFWEEPKDYLKSAVFSRLAEAGILDPAGLAKEYVGQQKEDREDTKASWVYMHGYLHTYMKKIQSPKAFQTFAAFMEAWDDLKDSEKADLKTLLLDSFEIHIWGSGQRCFENMSFLRTFLTAEEHNQMFFWLEQAVFQKLAEQYPFFLARILEDPDTVLWMPKEEAREICFRILPQLHDTYYEERLQRRYMTEEEFERQKQEKRELERRKERMEEEKELKKLKKSFTRWLADKNQTERLQLGNFLSGHRYPWREAAEKMAAGYLRSFWKKGQRLPLSKQQSVMLLELEIDLFKQGYLPFETIKDTVSSMEVEYDA